MTVCWWPEEREGKVWVEVGKERENRVSVTV